MIIDYKQLTGLKRIPLHLWDVPGFKEVGHKPYMTKEEVYELLSGIIYVSEKIDGKTGFDFYQTSTSEEDINTIVFYEDTLTKHSIDYKKKYRKLVFDMAQVSPEGGIQLCHYWDREDILDDYFPNYSFISHKGYRGTKEEISYWINFFTTLLKTSSKYGAPKIEGLVIKNYKKGLFGKIVNPEFEEGIKENYIRASRSQ